MELWWPTFSLAPESIDFMSEQEFGLRYCGARLNSYGRFEFRGASRVEELRQKLTLFFMHIVREEQLSHPERRRRIIFLPDSRPVEIRNWSRDNLSRVSFTDFIGEDDCSGELATLRRMIGLAKSPNAAKFIRERLAVGERILAFFWHREVGDELKRLLAHDEIICGNTPNAERVAQFDEFQAGYRQLILGNVQAMGRGVNLQNASRVIFVEFSWTDETNKQAEKRASRRGNNAEFVPCDYLAMPNSLDEIVLQVLFKKQSLVDRTIR
jgi:SNF2 family DNA or RNA helicase